LLLLEVPILQPINDGLVRKYKVSRLEMVVEYSERGLSQGQWCIVGHGNKSRRWRRSWKKRSVDFEVEDLNTRSWYMVEEGEGRSGGGSRSGSRGGPRYRAR
jgi:hypothetical protein